MRTLGPLAAGCALLAACAAGTRRPVALPVEMPLRLVSVDGHALDDGFRIEFRQSGDYRATYDCNDHFGRYRIAGQLVLSPGPSTLTACDQIDLRSGISTARPNAEARRFFAVRAFLIRRTSAGVVLRGGGHTFAFSRQH